MRANGQVEAQPLLIQRDPRLTDVTDTELREQFRLAIQIRDKTSQAHEAVIRIRAIRQQADQRAAAGAVLAGRVAALEAKLSEVEQDLYQTRNRSPRDTLNYPIKLNNQLAVLQKLVDTGDARPTDSDYAVFKELTAKLDGILARLNDILATDLKALNGDLAAKGVDLVK